MTEVNLSAAIDKAAKQRAAAIMADIKESISKAVTPYWRTKQAGGEYIRGDILRVLAAMGRGTEWRDLKVVPSRFLVDACRAKIVNDLLNELPQVNELSRMPQITETFEPISGTGDGE